MWILPSLGRPERAQEVAEAAPDAPIMLRLHWGDRRLDDYMRVRWPEAWRVVTAKNLSLCDTLNWAFETNPDAENYGFLADDTIPSPDDWWESLEYSAGYWNIAYPNDGVHGKNLCTHHCIGGRLVREVGWWALPGLKHNYVDTVWQNIGANLNLLRYRKDVKFNHAHPINKKADTDATYKIGQGFYESDGRRFEKWVSDDASALINGLKESLGVVY